VILAAGMGSRLRSVHADRPKGLLRLGPRSILEESLDRLRAFGIRTVVLVTGYRADHYLSLRPDWPQLRFVHNSQFADSGSMYSLFLARNTVKNKPFLLLESDLIYEKRALMETVKFKEPDCILLSGKTGSGDEVYAGGNNGLLRILSKDKTAVPDCVGELVGVSKISPHLMAAMISAFEAKTTATLEMEYENAIVWAAAKQPVHYHVIPDLAWAEIDDPSHLERAGQKVYPLIQMRDGQNP